MICWLKSNFLACDSRHYLTCGIVFLLGAILLSTTGLAVPMTLKMASESEAEETEGNIEALNSFRCIARRICVTREVHSPRSWPIETDTDGPKDGAYRSVAKLLATSHLIGSGIRILC